MFYLTTQNLTFSNKAGTSARSIANGCLMQHSGSTSPLLLPTRNLINKLPS